MLKTQLHLYKLSMSLQFSAASQRGILTLPESSVLYDEELKGKK